MNKGIVFGAGYLGHRVAESFGYKLSKTNLLDLPKLINELDLEKPNIVINTAGKTGRPNIDWCELNKEATLQSNVAAPINLSAEAAKRGIYFVHMGSGCIYQGDNNGKGFSETDTPNFYGNQFYGNTKIISEQALNELPGLILRIRMPIDNHPHPRNLIDKLTKYSHVIDIPNSMTTIPHMLKSLNGLIEISAEGTYNMVNPGTMTAKKLMELYQEIVDPNHSFNVMSLDTLNKETLAKRSNCILNDNKLKSKGLGLPEINNAVEECLQNYATHKK